MSILRDDLSPMDGRWSHGQGDDPVVDPTVQDRAIRHLREALRAERLKSLFAAVELRNPAIPTELHWAIGDDGTVHVSVCLLVGDRDGGPPLRVSHSRGYGSIPTPDGLRDLVLFAWTHELDECWHVDGIRVRDPHGDGGGSR